MRQRHVAVFTGTRADYPRVRRVLYELSLRPAEFRVSIIVTGQHLLDQFGLTLRYVEEDNFGEIFKVEMYPKDSPIDDPYQMATAFSRCAVGLSNIISDIRPDFAIVTVDRVETLAFASVLALANIPIAHIQGGEISGTIDESIRHAVSKLSHIHFPANEEAKNVLIQLGEQPHSVHLVGCPYVDEIIAAENRSLQPILEKYSLPKKYGIAIYHPVTTEYVDDDRRYKDFYSALVSSNLHYLVIEPNNDAGSKNASKIPNSDQFSIVKDVYFEDYLTLLANSELIVGNSSSGIREAPNFGVPTVNVGSRQNGRVRAPSVVDVGDGYHEIAAGIASILQNSGTRRIRSFPFGRGGAAKRIVSILRDIEIEKGLLNKKFYYV